MFDDKNGSCWQDYNVFYKILATSFYLLSFRIVEFHVNDIYFFIYELVLQKYIGIILLIMIISNNNNNNNNNSNNNNIIILHSTRNAQLVDMMFSYFWVWLWLVYFHATNCMWSTRIWAKSPIAQKVSVHAVGMEIGLRLFVGVG